MYVLLGLPPQIKWIRYAPGQHFTQFITKEHAIACDMFGTTCMAVWLQFCGQNVTKVYVCRGATHQVVVV